MIEQNARQALAHVDRGYVLEGGQVRLSDTARALRENAEIGQLYLGG
jgi:ABC-type branched-subunit amino acid transport system ATPase component